MRLADNYFFTPGVGFADPASFDTDAAIAAAGAPDAGVASICPGDSGGPVYRDDGTQTKIVGVNSYYDFAPSDTQGISFANWHTRLDLEAGLVGRPMGARRSSAATSTPASSTTALSRRKKTTERGILRAGVVGSARTAGLTARATARVASSPSR